MTDKCEHRPHGCKDCYYKMPELGPHMTAMEYIEYTAKTKGQRVSCFGGRIGLLIACTNDDMRMMRVEGERIVIPQDDDDMYITNIVEGHEHEHQISKPEETTS